MKRILFLVPLAALLLTPAAHAAVATFDDLSLVVPPAENYTGAGPGRYYNGADEAGGFSSGGAIFANTFAAGVGWVYWDGWSVSSTTDLDTPGVENQYSAYHQPAGGGHSGNVADQYGVFFEPFGGVAKTVDFGGPVNLVDAYITNTTYAYKAVVEGNDGSSPPLVEQFGLGDWFKVTVWGFDASGAQSNSLDVYLADYRSSDENQWYALNAWTQVDLSSLGTVHGLGFDLDSSDFNAGGIITPGYFAMDDLSFNPVPIPGAVWLLGGALLGLAGWSRSRPFYSLQSP